MSKQKAVICRICLRTDLLARDIKEELVDFHDEITEYGLNENNALKYCSVCEHLLLKFYNFTQKCRRANKILKRYRRKNGRYPDDLHKMLPPSPLACIQSTFQYKINTITEPWTEHLVIIKKEIIEDVLLNDIKDNDTSDMLETKDDLQENNSSYVDLEDSENPLSLLKVEKTENMKVAQNNEEQNTNEFEVKLEDYSSDVQGDNYNEDSSDTEMINELEKQIIQIKRKPRERKRGQSLRPKQPLHNRKELEKVFEIHVFATENEAKDELELRKTSERYLTAENRCEICYMVCKHSKQLEFHMQRHDPSAGDYECSVCRMRFLNKKAVANHKYGSHYGIFKCKVCPLITYHKLAMAKHYQRHSGFLFTCQHCNRTFTHASTYKAHVRLRHVTDHVCVTCAQTFVSEKGLAFHRSKKHKTKSKVDKDATAHCEPCGLTFANEQVYTVHIINADKHMDLARTIIACKVCGLRFESNQDMLNHKRSTHLYPKRKPVKIWTRTSKDTYSCSICGAVGTSNTWVYKHVASVHPDSPYMADLAKRRQHMCETCGKCYTTIYALRDHISTHTGIKPFTCPKCPASFSSRTRLLLHEEWHAAAKRECKQCGKKFVSASNLSNHMRSHIQDRRYKCSICPKGFIHSNTLREHVRGVHHNVRRVRKLVKRETVACES